MTQTIRSVPFALQLSEPERPPERIQVMRVGTFHLSGYGKFEITKEHLVSFKKNFDANVRGVDLALDYGHNSAGEAAGWFKDLQLSDDGNELWAAMTWTPEGGKAVSDARYRYVSADFSFDYQDNETQKKFGPTLLGAGLTNRPVIKGQAPVIELTEQKEQQVDLETLKAQLADANKKIAELQAQIDADKKADESGTELADAQKKIVDQEKQLSEANAKLAKIEEDKKHSEKKAAFDLKLSEGKVVEAQREPFMKGDMDKFIQLSEPVNSKNKGHGDGKSDDKGDAQDEVLKLAEKAVQEKRSPSKREAISLVLSENPELRKRYEASQA